jgi:hypothetical protein
MMATHVLPSVTADGEVHPAYLLASGRASALFAVLAGVGLASPPVARRRCATAASSRLASASSPARCCSCCWGYRSVLSTRRRR